MSKKYCLISHTHWDREWYLPLENFRMRLVDLIDHLLDILEADAGYRFHLDAQTIVLDDYLEIRPHKKAILEKHIREERILVGPWYVQNDFHLTSGEATVRNLLIGTKMAEDYGKCMQIGYAADQFGLISQLPQILARFGIDNCVFGRGFDRGVTEFFWESEDGSRVLCEHMRYWYNNAQRLSPDPDGALSLLRSRGEACAAVCAGSGYLLMNGVDHLEAQEDLTEILEKVRPMLNEDEEVFQDTLPEFIARLKKEVAENGIELKTFTGEFRDNGAANVLSGTLSSRVYLKQMNAHTQAVLEKKLEPLYTMLASFGVKAYPQDYLTYLWKVLIQNHPHDSICGCSVDAVHRHMVDRYIRIAENTSDLFDRGVHDLTAHIPADGLDKTDCRILLFNPTQLADNRTLDVEVDIPVNEDKGSFVIYDEDGREVPYILTGLDQNRGRRILSPINLPGDSRVNRYYIRMDAGATPGVGYRTLLLKLKEGDLEVQRDNTEVCAYTMDSEGLHVEIHANGTVDLTEKRSGKLWKDLLAIEDCVDRGDSYNYVAGDPATRVTSLDANATVTVAQENGYVSARKIAYTLSIDREEGAGTIDVEMTLTLDKYSDELHVDVKLHNSVKHHRVRLLVPTDLAAEQNYAGDPFNCYVRDRVSRFPNDFTHPNTDYVGVEDGQYGIALLNEGLYEYEQMTDARNTLAITLLRSTGIISGGYAEETVTAPEWLTPEGFLLGETNCRLAIVPYRGNHIDAKIAARAARFLSPVIALSRAVDYNKFIGGRPFVQGPGMPDLFYRPLENADRNMPSALTFPKIDSNVADAMILSALKCSENGDGVIVRLYNSVSETVTFTLETGLPIRKAENAWLNEKSIAEIPVENGNQIRLTASPKEIVTVKFSF